MSTFLVGVGVGVFLMCVVIIAAFHDDTCPCTKCRASRGGR